MAIHICNSPSLEEGGDIKDNGTIISIGGANVDATGVGNGGGGVTSGIATVDGGIFTVVATCCSILN